MGRILVDPEQLQSLASQFSEVTGRVQDLGRRAASGLDHIDWASNLLQQTFERMQEAGRTAEALAAGSAEHEHDLRQTAARFLEANAWRPTRSGAGQVVAPGGATAGPSTPAGPSAPGRPAGPGVTPPVAPPGDPLAPVYSHFTNPQMQAIMAHVIDKEGMGAPNVAHGAVVYRGENGLRCDKQWLNFGYISFAMPAGSGQDVLREILSKPGEAEAFRESALRHLHDFGGGEVPASHQDFVKGTGAGIPALSANEQADQFIALLKKGDDAKLAEWFFKYANEPATQSGVATGHLREDWSALMGDFLARPASVDAQLDSIQHSYVEPATDSAQQFGFHSSKAVAWFVDQHVQSGGPSNDMLRMLEATPPPASDPLCDEWKRFHAGGEPERLQVLTELAGSPGTTVRNRREVVLNDPSLTWDPFAGIN